MGQLTNLAALPSPAFTVCTFPLKLLVPRRPLRVCDRPNRNLAVLASFVTPTRALQVGEEADLPSGLIQAEDYGRSDLYLRWV